MVAHAMPGATLTETNAGRTYHVDGKPFLRINADHITVWVNSQAQANLMVDDDTAPFTATTHHHGQPRVLAPTHRLDQLAKSHLRLLAEQAWLSQATKTRAAAWRRRKPHPIKGETPYEPAWTANPTPPSEIY
jgi:hypothetical protein